MHNVIDKIIRAGKGYIDSDWLNTMSVEPYQIQLASMDILNWIQRRVRLQKPVPLLLQERFASHAIIRRMLESEEGISELFELKENAVQFKPSLLGETINSIELYVVREFEIETEV